MPVRSCRYTCNKLLCHFCSANMVAQCTSQACMCVTCWHCSSTAAKCFWGGGLQLQLKRAPTCCTVQICCSAQCQHPCIVLHTALLKAGYKSAIIKLKRRSGLAKCSAAPHLCCPEDIATVTQMNSSIGAFDFCSGVMCISPNRQTKPGTTTRNVTIGKQRLMQAVDSTLALTSRQSLRQIQTSHHTKLKQ